MPPEPRARNARPRGPPPPTSYSSVHLGRDQRGERRACAIQSRLHRAEIAVRDLRDFFVRLALEFAEHKYLTMMRWQERDRSVHDLPQMPFVEQVVRA